MSDQYTPDEFDRDAADMPVGVHRQPVSRWRAVLPFLAVLVLVPLLALGANRLLSGGAINRDGGSQSGTTTQAQSSQSPQPTTEPTTEPQSTPEPAPAEPEPAPVQHDAAIEVLNGTSTTGLAAEKVAILTSSGFTTLSAANADGWTTELSTVYYANPDLQATAEEVGRALGITEIKLNETDLGDKAVVVVLR